MDQPAEEPHHCAGMATLTTTVSQLKAEVQLLRLGCRFSHVADNPDLVGTFNVSMQVTE